MSAAVFTLHRYEDKSGVSGVGQVAEGIEFSDGSVALRWPGEHPSTAVWSDIRDMEAIHGHGGLTVVEYVEPARLLSAYRQVMFWLGREMRPEVVPISVEPHPLWPDRLQARFADESSWRLWIALMDGSTDAASHDQAGDNWTHTWVSADGNVWLTYASNDTEEI